ncbi:helix-turn-helix domain-containing protein [Brevibacillus sp. SYSU BS000544]|uniref:helix-turn-helix domain-containing protein n=1 Tax=Brevibacillus sp. SYSU BS000544 TaxID=3416443 RepID=UPI003CE4D506
MKQLTVYFLTNIGVCHGDITDIQPHSHHFIQLCFGLQAGFRIMLNQQTYVSKACIITNDIEHQYTGLDEHQVIVLLDPESTIGQDLKAKLLKDLSILQLDSDIIKIFYLFEMNPLLPLDEVSDVVERLFLLLLGYENSKPSVDSRIASVQSIIKHNPSEYDSKSLADSVFLSESRLIHLFKEQVGISMKQYVLWQKLMKSITYMMSGESLTVAAVNAGFADSAHFSRTFKRMFGITPSEVFKNGDLVRVVVGDRY